MAGTQMVEERNNNTVLTQNLCILKKSGQLLNKSEKSDAKEHMFFFSSFTSPQLIIKIMVAMQPQPQSIFIYTQLTDRTQELNMPLTTKVCAK